MDHKKLDKWSEYFKELLNKRNSSTAHSLTTPKRPTKVDENHPRINEIEDNFHSEILKMVKKIL